MMNKILAMTLPSELLRQTRNIPDLLAAVTNKDARHRVSAFIDWMHERRSPALRPNAKSVHTLVACGSS